MTSPRAVPDVASFVSTRDSLHRIAEHVVAKARYLDDGEIRLTAFPGGFATPLLAERRRVRVEGDEIVVDDRDESRRARITSVGEAAAFVGIESGFPEQLYPAATPLRPDEALALDRAAAEALAEWYGFTAGVLAAYRDEMADARPSELILWPEHFDQAFYTEDDDERRRSNYGASPGDVGHQEPYLYVGPWAAPAPGEFWNATNFPGAVLPLSAVVAAPDPVAAALEFLRAGRRLLLTA